MLTPRSITARLWDMAHMVEVRLRPMKEQTYAEVTYDSTKPRPKIIYLPPDKNDEYQLRVFIHELAHLALPAELNLWCNHMLEDILEYVVEPEIVYYIRRYRTVHRKWLIHMNKLIEKGRNAADPS